MKSIKIKDLKCCDSPPPDDLILTELRKIVQGNAAIFAQVRMIRMMMEKQEKRAAGAMRKEREFMPACTVGE